MRDYVLCLLANAFKSPCRPLIKLLPTLVKLLLTCSSLAEELARMKEKDRLRKEYVEELRKRHEGEAQRLEAQLAKEQRSRREEQASRVEVLHTFIHQQSSLPLTHMHR